MNSNTNDQQDLNESEAEREEETTASENSEGAEQSDSSDTGNKSGETKSYTQRQLNRMMTREKNQGRNAALRELGIDPKDTKTITLLQSILKGTANDQQGESANDQQLAEANQRALVAEIKAEAMKQSAQANFVDDIVTLVLGKLDSEDESSVSTVVGEFKTKYPAWFGVGEDEEADKKDKEETAGQRGTGSSVRGNSSKSGDKDEANSLGKRLAAQRKNQNPSKKSFWG